VIAMPKKPPHRSTYHHGDLRNALIKESALLIERRQDVEFTIRDLAQRLGISHSAAYRHFRDKTAILAALAEQGFGLLAERLAGVDAAHGASARELLGNKGLAYVQFAMDKPGYFRAMFYRDLGDRTAYPGLQEAAETAFQSLVATVATGHKKKHKDPAAVRISAIRAWALAHGLACLLLDGQVPELTHSKGRARDKKKLAAVLVSVLASKFDE
jgi:AcrR family transcriptional regulator